MIGATIAKKKVRSAFESITRHDLDAFLANWAEDATFIYPGSQAISGEVKGKKAIEERYRKFVQQFPLTSFTVKNICVQNIFALGGTNVLAVEWDIKLSNREGESFENSGVTMINLKKSKATLVRNYITDSEVERIVWGQVDQE